MKLFILILTFLSAAIAQAGYFGELYQPANTILAGPTSGGSGASTFRSLVSADIPALPYSSNTLTSAHLFVGSAGNVATDTAVSGDLTLANTGAFTIANSAVTNAKIANATIDLTAKVTGVLPIANGGTNGSTATAGFDNLSPLTTKGDSIWYSGTHNVRVAACANGNQFQFDSTQANGIKCVTPSAGGSQAYTLNNQSGTYYALAPTDGYANGNFPLLTMSNSATQQVLVPNHAITPFATGERIAIHQLGTADVQIIPDTSVTLHSPDGTVMSAQYSHAELVQTAPDVWTLNGNHLQPLIVATCTSCSMTTSGKFKIATFNVSDTLVISKGSGQIASFIVAGGGGGGAGYAGGGGAGGVLYTTLASAATYMPGSYTVTIGNGGAGGSQGGNLNSFNGQDSVFDPSGTNVRATGGGAGGNGFGTSNAAGNGGSGGGGSAFVTVGFAGGTGVGGQGFAGGTGNSTYGGGGGGASAVGANGAGNNGQGGAGETCPNATMCGATVYGGGGGAAVWPASQAATGGSGGGGAGVFAVGSGATGVAGTANRGGGGGGGSDNVTGGVGGAGGSGQIVLMWQYQ